MRKIRQIFQQYNEWLIIGLLLVSWFVGPKLLRLLDPVAGFFDAGVLQLPGFAAYCMVVFWAMAWGLMKLSFPLMSGYFYNELQDLFKKPSTENQWLKFLTSFSLLFLLGLSFWIPLFVLR